MTGTTYALWDKIDKNYLSWSWGSYKRAKEEMNGYFNNKQVSILKVVNKRVVHEMNRELCIKAKNQTVSTKLAQSKLY